MPSAPQHLVVGGTREFRGSSSSPTPRTRRPASSAGSTAGTAHRACVGAPPAWCGGAGRPSTNRPRTDRHLPRSFEIAIARRLSQPPNQSREIAPRALEVDRPAGQHAAVEGRWFGASKVTTDTVRFERSPEARGSAVTWEADGRPRRSASRRGHAVERRLRQRLAADFTDPRDRQQQEAASSDSGPDVRHRVDSGRKRVRDRTPENAG